MNPPLFSACLIVAAILSPHGHAAKIIETDICVYGGAAGGVTAAVQAARIGKTVSLVVVNNHLGGLSSGGLGETDIGNNGNAYIQGMALEFYTRVGAKYNETGAKFRFEPKVAEAVFNEMAQQAGVPVYFDRHLTATTMADGRITQITTQTGDIFRAKVFIDASYEGDLMKQAGVSYTAGREANSQYAETINGIQTVTHGNQLPDGIDPYVIPGNPGSGLLPGVNAAPSGVNGSADSLIQAFCYRMCLTNVAANRIMVPQPPGYNEADYEILFRAIAAGQTTRFWKTSAMPNGKTDSNNDSGISCDFISGTTGDWIEADHATRLQLAQAHEKWQRGFVWTLQNHPRVPAAVRTAWGQWGLPKDEFPDNGNWPHQLYVREARRMVSDYVMTEKNCMGTVVAADSIGLGAYTMDSHNCQRIVNNGMVKNEGDIQRAVPGPYPISYRSIIPKVGQCQNLLVPWSLSATHIAFGSIRMEPVFMNLGQSAATAAAFSIDDGVPVQGVSYPKLKAQMLSDSQRITLSDTATANEVIVDNASPTGVTLAGSWVSSTSTTGYQGADYLHDADTRNGSCSAQFTPALPTASTYGVYLRWTSHTNRASNVPVEIRHLGGISNVSPAINQRSNGGQWILLGSYQFQAGTSPSQGSVTLRNTSTDGFVIADAVRFVDTAAASPIVRIWATNSQTRESPASSSTPAVITISRSGSVANPLTVHLNVGGSATPGADYLGLESGIIIPSGSAYLSVPLTALTDSIPEGPEYINAAITGDLGYSLGELTSCTVTLQDTPFDTWRFSKFSAEHLNDPSVSGPQADPDQDGTANLLEFFSGRNPIAADAPPKVSLLNLNGSRILETERQRAAREIFVRVEQSRDLSAWIVANMPQGAPAITETAPNLFQLLQFTILNDLDSSAFYRLAVSEVPFAH